MSANIRIVTDDAYEEMAATYQCLEIARLNQVLKRHGITDSAQRRKICADYFYDSGSFLDACWFKAEGKTVYPELCYSERAHF